MVMQKADNDSFILSPQKNLDWLHTPPNRQHPYPGIKCHIESVSLLLCAVLDLIEIVLRGNQAISAR